MTKRQVGEWKPMIKRVVDSKVNEFTLLGYGDVTSKVVWDCLLTKVWKNDQTKMLHEVVQDVLHLNGHVYMSYIAMESYKQDDDLMASIEALRGME